MATRRNTARGEAAADGPAPLDALNALPHQQMVAATQGACAVFRGFEAIRKVQEAAAHHALQQHQHALERLRASNDPAQWLAIEADLLRFDAEGATQYWQQLGAAALQMQTELMDCMLHAVDAQGTADAVSPLNMMPALATSFGQFFKGNARSEAS